MNVNAPTPAMYSANNNNVAASKNGGVTIAKNNINALQEFQITLFNGTGGAKTNLLLFPGPVPAWLISRLGCTETNQTATTGQLLSSSVSANDATGYTQMKAYLAQMGFQIDYIRFQTSDTTLYDGSLWIGEVPVNGILAPEEIVLAPYATVIGGGGTYDKSLTIADRTFNNTRNFFMYLSNVPASSTTRIAFGISLVGNTVTVSAQ